MSSKMSVTCFLQNSEIKVGISAGRLQMRHDSEIVGEHPLETVERLVVFGNPQITTQAIKECLRSGIEIQYYTQSGKFIGGIEPHAPKVLQRRLNQYKTVTEDSSRLLWSKALIRAKLRSQALEYRRMIDNGWHEREVSFLHAHLDSEKHLEKASNIAEAMGIEGLASRRYYELLAGSLPEGWRWHGRQYHPAPDELNALLSLTYSLATSTLESECRKHGLEPMLSVMHRINYGSGGLATDLIEPFRASVCDHHVLKMLHGGKIVPADFTCENGEFRMHPGRFKRYISNYREYLLPKLKVLSSNLFKLVCDAIDTLGDIPDFVSLQPLR